MEQFVLFIASILVCGILSGVLGSALRLPRSPSRLPQNAHLHELCQLDQCHGRLDRADVARVRPATSPRALATWFLQRLADPCIPLSR